jgi:two-component system cell cycle sensor histidine kinase/response regulator CckA
MNVLYVEDNSSDADLLKRALSRKAPQINLEWVTTCKEARAKLEACTPDRPLYDVLLTDMELPDGEGISLIPLLHEQNLPIAVVVITGMRSEEAAVVALKTGINDYVAKQGDYLSRLPNILETALHRYRTETTPHSRALRVLYAEHNASDIDITTLHFLRYAPYIHLETVSSADDVLKKMPSSGKDVRNVCDVLLVDCHLPHMNGIELLKELLEVRSLDLPIVVVAGHGNEESVIQAFRLGATDYVVKHPGYLHKLTGILENAFNRAQLAREQKTLKASEEYFRSLIENASDIIMVIDQNGAVRYASPSYERLLGFTSEEVTKAKAFSFLHPDDESSALHAIANTMADPYTTGPAIELRLRHKDGSWRYIESIGKVLKDPSGQPIVVVNLRDVTERKRTEEALRESEERYHTFINSTSDMVFLKDEYFRYVLVNKELTEFFEKKEEEIIGKTDFELMPEESAHNCRKTDMQALKSSSIVISEETIGDNSYETMKFSVRLSRDRTGVGGFIRDITERRETEAALFESETKYRKVVENSLAGFYIIQDNLFRFVNKRFSEILGYTYEEIVDILGPNDLAHAEDRGMVEENIRKRLSDGIDYIEYDFRALRKDGKVITLKALGSSILYNGKPAATGTLIDITKEKTLESQLRQAQKMEAIGILAGGVAHDFNNILTALTGYGTLLQLKLDKENPLRPYVDQILSASMKGANLTRSLLAFSRKQPITLNPVNLNNIIKGTEKLLKRLLTEDIILKTLLTSDNIMIMADPTQIDQILFNVVTNARDAMTKGGSLTIETKVVILDKEFVTVHGFGEQGKYALLSISDTGAGMDAAVKEHIFDPFFTTKEVGKGTGLGLSTTYGIVKQHKGYITVYSEPGIGTTFRIYLPLTSAAVETDTSSSESIRGGKETVLVAEDDKEVRHLIKNILVEFGYTIIEAKDGEDAINKFNKHKNIDLLILDSVMPKKNGKAVYDEVSATTPHIKVIFTSGYTRDVVLDKGIEDKKFDFIPKPLSPRELLEKVRKVLDKNR